MTLKANELRIGNYLNGKQGHVIITEIRENNIVKIQDNTSSFYVGTCLKPIPLTKEWLLKFGFVFGIELQDFVKGKHQFIELNCLCGYFSENDIFYYAEKTKLKYVHQLQNLYFALTGDELTLKNNSNN